MIRLLQPYACLLGDAQEFLLQVFIPGVKLLGCRVQNFHPMRCQNVFQSGYTSVSPSCDTYELIIPLDLEVGASRGPSPNSVHSTLAVSYSQFSRWV